MIDNSSLITDIDGGMQTFMFVCKTGVAFLM